MMATRAKLTWQTRLGPWLAAIGLVLASCSGTVSNLVGDQAEPVNTAPQDGAPQDPDPKGTSSTTTEVSSEPVTFLVFGDAADCRGRDAEVAAKVAESKGDILFLGDAAYPDGSTDKFDACFLPIYGEQLGRFRAVPGDNDYKTSGASGFFSVFGSAAGDPNEGWFSFESSGWQIIGLNANCEFIGGCDETSPQYAWLKGELAATPGVCRLSLASLPRFTSSANYDGIPRLGPLYELLYGAGSDFFFAGNSHHYERFERLGIDGEPDPNGIMNVTVGTGGAPLTQFAAEPRPGSVLRNNDSFGYLELTLTPGHFEYSFVTANEDGTLADSGSGDCLNQPG